MKNKLNILLILPLIIIASMGCGLIERVQKTATGDNSNTAVVTTNSNKSITDRAIEQVADGETTGVKECDEVIAIFADQAKSEDDNWATKATKDYITGQMKKAFRESIEQNKDDKAKMAEQCRDYKVQLEKQLKADQEKQKK